MGVSTGPPGPPGPPPSYWQAPAPVRPGPAPGVQYAGFWIRVAAYLLDAIPLLILGAILLIPLFGRFFGALQELPFPPRGTPVDSEEYQAFQTLMLQRMQELMAPMYTIFGLLQLITIVYFIGFWTAAAQTPGMMLLGLELARDADGTAPGFARSILRYIGFIVSGAVFFIGFIWVAFDSRKQGWHDKIAGTVVVRRSG
jgi:uncharacterized RDD family membrane protein YckC